MSKPGLYPGRNKPGLNQGKTKSKSRLNQFLIMGKPGLKQETSTKPGLNERQN